MPKRKPAMLLCGSIMVFSEGIGHDFKMRMISHVVRDSRSVLDAPDHPGRLSDD